MNDSIKATVDSINNLPKNKLPISVIIDIENKIKVLSQDLLICRKGGDSINENIIASAIEYGKTLIQIGLTHGIK